VKQAVLFIAITLMLALIVVANAAEQKSAWQREWEKILDGAKKEGEVRLWGDQEITHPDIIAGFVKEYPNIKPVTSLIFTAAAWAADRFSISIRRESSTRSSRC
jgi:hypothetical protein